jgi:hypothetical protein
MNNNAIDFLIIVGTLAIPYVSIVVLFGLVKLLEKYWE